jgi:hypothetical protein
LKGTRDRTYEFLYLSVKRLLERRRRADNRKAVTRLLTGERVERTSPSLAAPGKGEGKRKGKKVKGGKRQREDTARCASTTPDGKRICYSFNNKATPCDRHKCQFLHVCGRCFKDHPLWQCPN